MERNKTMIHIILISYFDKNYFMHTDLINWKNTGEYIAFGTHRHQLFVKRLGSANATAEKTLLLLHGFPESSFSYHLVVNGLLDKFDQIILFDMIGYGFSDKPTDNYSYSLMEQADSAFEVWKHFGIKGGHLLAHDMGCSVATEIVARHVDGQMPDWFSDGLKSLTLTNGSVVLSLSKLRSMQKLLLTKAGFLAGKLVNYPLFKQQIKSAHGNSNLSEETIAILYEGNKLQNGHKKSYLTIKYINDRKRYEHNRWLPALAKTDLPIHICWGKDDEVAKVAMAYHLKEHVCPDCVLTVMDGVGHFGQLGNPDAWLNGVLGFYNT